MSGMLTQFIHATSIYQMLDTMPSSLLGGEGPAEKNWGRLWHRDTHSLVEDRQGNQSLQPNMLSAVMEFEQRALGQKSVGLTPPEGPGGSQSQKESSCVYLQG